MRGLSGPFPASFWRVLPRVEALPHLKARLPKATRESRAFSLDRSLLSPSLSIRPPVGRKAVRTCRRVAESIVFGWLSDAVVFKRGKSGGNADRVAADKCWFEVRRQVLRVLMRDSMSLICLRLSEDSLRTSITIRTVTPDSNARCNLVTASILTSTSGELCQILCRIKQVSDIPFDLHWFTNFSRSNCSMARGSLKFGGKNMKWAAKDKCEQNNACPKKAILLTLWPTDTIYEWMRKPNWQGIKKWEHY